jgi:tetratricopeptide (TPR) repeat protein
VEKTTYAFIITHFHKEVPMRKYFLFLLAALLFLGVGQATLFAQSVKTDTDLEIWSYMLRQSQVWFENMIKQYGEVPPGEWQEPLEAAFLRLSRYSGEKGFQIRYAILNTGEFNAAAFPGGQFVIFKGTLDFFDQVLQMYSGKTLDQIPPAQLKVMRQNLMAPIIAHELGHYYNRHAFKSMKKSWDLSESVPDTLDLHLIKYTQDNEFEADRTGYLLLKKAGYNPDSMIATLEILNALHQDQLKGISASAFNIYLETHPSPHQRLAQFKSKDQEWHKWAARLEQAISDISLGMNLDKAIKTLDQGLLQSPTNIYLLKARAVACHKRWLSTVLLKDQKLRGIIDLPAFRDDLVFSAGKRSKPKDIPGDKILYFRARDAYEKVYKQAVDPGFYSNYALLLAYSPDAKDEAQSLALADKACTLQPNYATFSNLGVVYFLVGKKKEALQLFGQLAVDYHNQYASLLGEARMDQKVFANLQSMRQRLKVTQMLNPEFVYSDFTPVLNYALVLRLTGDKKTARLVAKDYLNLYESHSLWAYHLSSMAGVALPKEPKKEFLAVNGIRVGATLKQVLNEWGKASEIEAYEGGEEVWVYKDMKAKLYISDGKVASIELAAAGSPKVENTIGIGSSKGEIEKSFGRHKRIADKYYLYEGRQNLAVLYNKNIAISIVLY